MIGFLDVHYFDESAGARAACVIVSDPAGASPVRCFSTEVGKAEPYIPGEFYRRELPCLLAVIEKVDIKICDYLIVDSYVDLEHGKKGMGRHLYEALDEKIPVIGVAKTSFHSTEAREVFRGDSDRPLFVTAAGTDIDGATKLVVDLHGEYRIPTMIRVVDQLARGISQS